MNVIWSQIAKDEYADLLQYLQDTFGLDSAIKFMDKTDDIINQISQFPKSGQSTKKETVRRFIITKQISIIYQISSDRIEILHLWDNRQKPETK